MGWIEQLIKEAQKKVEEVEVFHIEGSTVSADLKQKKVGLATRSNDCGWGVRTINKGRIGSSSANDPKRWRECLYAAIESGRLATPQAWGGLPDPAPLDQVPLCYDPAMKIEPKTTNTLLEQMLEGALNNPAEITSGSAALSVMTETLVNSNGVHYTSRQTGVSISLEAIKGQSTGYEFDQSCFFDRLDPFAVGERATFFASHSTDGREIPSGDFDVLLSPLAYADLLATVFLPALSGRNVHAGRSKLAHSLGEAVTDSRICMYDDPLMEKGNGSTRWDAEGVPTRRVDFIQDGVLKTFAYDLKTAYRYKKLTTANAVRSGFAGLPSIGHHNFVVDGKREGIADERVIYVHNVVGAHTANPISGEFSVELSNPFWMEHGEFDIPIRSAMLSGNVFDMHKEIGGISKESRLIGSLVLPSIRFKKQHIIGK